MQHSQCQLSLYLGYILYIDIAMLRISQIDACPMETDNYKSNLTLILGEKTEVKIRFEENRRAGSKFRRTIASA
jgi:hypothetical protein